MARRGFIVRCRDAWHAFRRTDKKALAPRFSTVVPAQFPNKWAILIGVDTYDRFRPLNFSSADVVAVKQAITNTLDFPEEHILEFHSSSDQQPSRSNILHNLAKLQQQQEIGADDLVIFYFSGHGMMSRKQKKDFLLTPGASPLDLEETALKVDRVVDILQSTKCKNIAMFIDACRETVPGGKGGQSIGREASEAAERAGIVTFFSCEPDELSYEIDDLNLGSFTRCVLNAIEEQSCNTARELDDFLRKKVPTLNSEYKKPPQLPYAIINPAEKGDLPIFFSQSQRLLTEDQLKELEKCVGDLAAEKLLDYTYLNKIIEVIERAQKNRLTQQDEEKLSFIRRACENPDFSKKTFEIYWDALERQSKRIPRTGRSLEQLH